MCHNYLLYSPEKMSRIRCAGDTFSACIAQENWDVVSFISAGTIAGCSDY